jgi:hypothetical protein
MYYRVIDDVVQLDGPPVTFEEWTAYFEHFSDDTRIPRFSCSAVLSGKLQFVISCFRPMQRPPPISAIQRRRRMLPPVTQIVWVNDESGGEDGEAVVESGEARRCKVTLI